MFHFNYYNGNLNTQSYLLISRKRIKTVRKASCKLIRL